MNVLTFDIETIPDADAGRRVYGLEGLSDAEAVQAMEHLRVQETGGSTFMRHHLHRIVAISLALRSADGFKLRTLGEPDDDEAGTIRKFFDGIAYYSPVLVSWNGGGFDLPVLHYRALKHGVSAPRYWETGDEDKSFRWNNYLNRFHSRHTDLMDVLAGYQVRAAAPLDQIAQLLDLPGKQGVGGGRVWDAYRAGELQAIRDYCEIDVLNTHLIYLRFELMRGRLDEAGLKAEEATIRAELESMQRPHLNEFLSAW